MTLPILQEYTMTAVPLTEQDAKYLSEKYVDQFDIRFDKFAGQWLVNPKQFVGVVTLPSGASLEIRPKVPVSSVFAMLAVAYEMPSPFQPELVAFASYDDIFAFIVAYFAELVQAQLAHGLYRTYVEQEDNLTMVRGRIAFADDLRANAVLRQRTYCRFAELTWDIPENQIIRQVLHQLSGWGFPQDLQVQLQTLDATLAEVTLTHWQSSVIDTFRYHRPNEAYAPIHQLCRLLLDHMSLNDTSGHHTFQSFLLDMNNLFKRFVTRLLQLHSTGGGMVVRDQYNSHLDIERQVTIRPDLVFMYPTQPMLIADCKYKRPEANVIQSDCYQLLAYCTAFATTQGVLIYPKTPGIVDRYLAIKNTPIHIRTYAIDLNLPGPALQQECERFARHLFALAHVSGQTGMSDLAPAPPVIY